VVLGLDKVFAGFLICLSLIGNRLQIRPAILGIGAFKAVTPDPGTGSNFVVGLFYSACAYWCFRPIRLRQGHSRGPIHAEKRPEAKAALLLFGLYRALKRAATPKRIATFSAPSEALSIRLGMMCRD
jgi:hypothetical protein